MVQKYQEFKSVDCAKRYFTLHLRNILQKRLHPTEIVGRFNDLDHHAKKSSTIGQDD